MKMIDRETYSNFKNNFLLSLTNFDLEKGFRKLMDKSMRKYGKWLGFFYLAYSVIALILQNQYWDSLMNKDIKAYQAVAISTYILPGIFSVNIILGFTIKNVHVQRAINWINFILLGHPLVFIRKILFDLNLVDEEIFSTFRIIEFFHRITLIFLLMLIVSESYLLILTSLVVDVIYKYFIFNTVPTSYIITCFLLAFISYFYTRQVKINFAIFNKLNHRNIWYKNFLQHFNSGFISLKNGRIDYINNEAVEIISKIKEISNIFQSPSKKKSGDQISPGGEDVELNVASEENTDYLPTKEEKVEIIKNNSMMIMNNLLYDLFLSHAESLTGNNHITAYSELNENFLDLVRSLREKIGFNEISDSGDVQPNRENKNKFIFLGFKEILLSPEGSGEKSHLEIFYRYNYSGNNDEIEIIINDITKIKNIEKAKAEVKYKTQILAKIAHEFKNPIICISELADQLTDTCRRSEDIEDDYESLVGREVNTKSVNQSRTDPSQVIFFKNPLTASKLFPDQILRQIKAFSNYLLIQVKNLDYFSHSEARTFPPLHITSFNLREMLDFVKQMGEILMIKYNKKAKFKIVHNLKEGCHIKTDEIKVKQVLVNLISNAVKNIVSGSIELIIHLDKGVLNLTLTDTGPGICPEKIKRIYMNRPLENEMTLDNHLGSGLGLSIVLDILKQLNSKLNIDSSLGTGTSFSFTLKVEEVELNDKISIKSSNSANDINAIKYVENSPESGIISKSKRTVQIDNMFLTKPAVRSRFCNSNRHSYDSNKDYDLKSIGEGSKFPLIKHMHHSYSFKNSEYNKDLTYYVVVDDEMIVRNSNIRTLKKAAVKMEKDIEIIEGADGVECVYLVYKYLTRGFKISAVISDELMTYMNGSKAADILKSLTKLTADAIPFISITAFSQTSNSNVDYFFSKPLDMKGAEEILKLAT